MEKNNIIFQDYTPEHIARLNEKEKLKYFSDMANKKEQEKERDESFENKTLGTLIKNFSNVFIDILYEILNIKDYNLTSISNIFIKKERMFYSGILFIILGIFMALP
jgi:hypothetical protein